MDNIELFKKSTKESLTVKLLLPDIDNSIIILKKNSGYLASIAYCAWKNNSLKKLDAIVEKFDIINKGTKDFKNRLKEIWLSKSPNRRRNVSNNTTAALAELVTANYFENIGCKNINLSATNSNDQFPDILYENDNQKYFCEVKYFEDSPELFNSRIRAMKNNGIDLINPPNDNTLLNYFFSRVAEAVLQLKNYKPSDRKVCLIFHDIAYDTGRIVFEENLNHFSQWYKDENGKYPAILSKSKKRILNASPINWLKEANILFIATMKNFGLINVKEYNFSI